MTSGLKAALSNSEKQRKVMLVKSDLENLLNEKTVRSCREKYKFYSKNRTDIIKIASLVKELKKYLK